MLPQGNYGYESFPSEDSSRRQTFTGAAGMNPTQFHRESFIKTVKKVWAKGEDFVRKLTGRKRRSNPETQRPETLHPNNTDEVVIYTAQGRRIVLVEGGHRARL